MTTHADIENARADLSEAMRRIADYCMTFPDDIEQVPEWRIEYETLRDWLHDRLINYDRAMDGLATESDPLAF